MSALSGLAAKGEKGKGKYTSININNIYKGTSAPTQKSAVSNRQHGLQSLGKVGGTRRMPPPAHLPSLRSENSGNDPNINLVPTGSSGWGSKEEQELEIQTKNLVENQASAKKVPEPGGRPQQLLLQQPVTSPSTQPQGQQNKATVGGIGPAIQTHGANTQGATNQQAAGNNTGQNISGNVGVKSWSSVTIGGKKTGGFLDQKSPFFQEEFPSLSAGEEKSAQPKKEEEKELQYGPGPSLRPQNVGNWKEGGGRSTLQQQDPQQNGAQMSDGAVPGLSGTEREADSDSNIQNPQPHPMMRHPVPAMGPMVPPHFRGMMPQYMFGRGFPPGYPPSFHPGMPRPPFSYPEQRFRGPHPGPPVTDGRRSGDERDSGYKMSIIKDQDLKQFDELLQNDPHDGDWAGAQVDIDYSEKLVFSDDEEQPKERDHERSGRDSSDRYSDGHGDRKILRDHRDGRKDGDRRKRRDEDYERRDKRDEKKDDRPQSRDSERDQGEYDRHASGERVYSPIEAWGPHPGQYGRSPVDQRQWQQIQMEHRGPAGAGFPPNFRMGIRGPVPPTAAQAQRLGPGGPVYPPGPSGHPVPSRSPGHPPSSPGAKGDEDEMVYNERRRQQNEMSAAVERARQRREEEERRIQAERKAAAQEKLKLLEDRLKKEDVKKGDSEKGDNSDTEIHRSRTGSESSDKSYNRNEKYSQGQQTRQYTKNLAPRFQRQQGQNATKIQQGQNPPSPQGTHPPAMHPVSAAGQVSPGMRQGQLPWFAGDPRAWGAMPQGAHGFMPGRPMDMAGLRRSRNNSGSESQESDRRTPEMNFDRNWADRSMPYGWEEQMRRNQMPAHTSYYDSRQYEYDRHERYEYDEKRKSEDRDSGKVRDSEGHAKEIKDPRDRRDHRSRDYDQKKEYGDSSRDTKHKEDRRERKDTRDYHESKKDRDDVER